MRQVRLGSYSIVVTLAGTPNLLRRKSILRYCRLWPPPWCRVVTWPLLLRPPVRRSGSSSDRSGVVSVTSAKSETERNRVAAVTGLNCRMPISALEDLDRVALFELHDRLLPRWSETLAPRVAAPLGAHHECPDVRHRHVEQFLDRQPDLRLRRLGVHPEGVFLARLVGRRRLLGHHGADDQLVQVRHRSTPCSRPPSRRRRVPEPRRRPRPTPARHRQWCRRSVARVRRRCCGPTDRCCAPLAYRRRAATPSSPSARASGTARPAAWSSASRSRAGRRRAAPPRAPVR